MNTIEAFREMINTRGIASELGMNDSTVRSLRRRMNNNAFISYNKMMELLTKAGYHIIQETIWSK